MMFDSKTIAGLVVGVCLTVLTISIYNWYHNRYQKTTYQEAAFSTPKGNKGTNDLNQAERTLLAIQISNPQDYITISDIKYNTKLFKTNEIQLTLTNQTEFIYYENIEIELYWVKNGQTVSEKAFLNRRLAPLDSETFSMYENIPPDVQARVKILSATGFVAPAKAQELGM